MNDDELELVNIEDMESAEAELEVIMYFKQMLDEGRDYVTLREIFEYFDIETDEDDDLDMVIAITSEGKDAFSVIAPSKSKLH